MSFEEIVAKYQAYLQAMGRALLTIKTNLSVIRHFNRELNGKDLRHLTEKDFLEFLSDSKKAKSTLFTRESILRSFFNWMSEDHYILKNPMLGLQRMRQPKLLPKNIMTQGETLKMLEGFSLEKDKPIQYRDRTILELLYSCSLRRSELVALNKNDYDPSTRSLRVKAGKTGKGRLVPIGKYASDLIETYLNEIRLEGSCEALFLTDKKKSRLSPTTITLKVYHLRKSVKIRTKASSHSFRKSSATHMLRNGASLLTVQALLGHSAITSTQAYTKLHPKDLIKMHGANHPREKHKNIKLAELKLPEYLYSKVKFQPT